MSRGAGTDRRSTDRRNYDGRDRRVDLDARKRVAQMSPDEMKRTLLTHELTGIKNRRAWEEAEPMPVQAAIDADSLKWFNDTMGHEAGDRMLRSIASALEAVTPHAYHMAGDEFVIQGESEREVREALSRARRILRGVTIESSLPNGTVVRKTGVDITFGIGTCRSSSESALRAAKAQREAAGDRAGRGQAPRGGLDWISAAGAGSHTGERATLRAARAGPSPRPRLRLRQRG